MKRVGPLILLICGVLATAGIFLPFQYDDSGWELISVGSSGIEGASITILIGSILIFAFALPTVIVAMNPRGSQKVVRNLGILASVGAAVAIIGATWFFAQAFTRSFDIGFYITTLSAAFGMFFGILTSQRAGFQIESKLPLGLLLVFIGIILIVILPGIGDGSM